MALLEPGRIGVELSEEYQLHPEQSTVGAGRAPPRGEVLRGPVIAGSAGRHRPGESRRGAVRHGRHPGRLRAAVDHLDGPGGGRAWWRHRPGDPAAMIGPADPALGAMLLDDFGSTSSIEDTTVAARITAEVFAEDLLWQPGAEELIDADPGRRAQDRAGHQLAALAGRGRPRPARPAPVRRDRLRRRRRAREARPDPYLAAMDRSGCPRRSAWPWRIRRPVPRRPCRRYPVLVVPSEVPVPEGPGRIFANSLLGATVDELHHIHREFRRSVRRGSA